MSGGENASHERTVLGGAAARLAVEGGAPVRASLLPYARQWIEEDDVQAVVDVLRSDWLTTGPRIPALEEAVATSIGIAHGVAVSSGTAALHAAAYALGVGPGDEVIVPAITFAASANCVVYLGATPVFADVDPATLLLDPVAAEERLSDKTKAIIAVDYAGQPCDYDALRRLTSRTGVSLLADASHSLGATYHGRAVGSLADVSTFSFHPVKHVAAGEGGLVTTDRDDLALRMTRFRNHGIDVDHAQRTAASSWRYSMVDLGYNYRLSDIHAGLALSQFGKLARWLERRRAIAAFYDREFSSMPCVRPLETRPGVEHAYHLYVVRLDDPGWSADRQTVFTALRAEGIGVNVHYLPVHLHPYYRTHFGTAPGDCPAAERAYENLLTLPLFPGMSDQDVGDVITAVRKVAARYWSPVA